MLELSDLAYQISILNIINKENLENMTEDQAGVE